MDRVYRRQRHVYDWTRRYYLIGRDRLIRRLQLKPGDKAVEVGCGTARNLIAVARLYPGTRLFGLDASHAMLATAARAVSGARLEERITLVQGYAEALSPEVLGEVRPLDCAIFSYSLSMIPDWRRALTAAIGSLSPAGRLHIVDFGDLSGLGRLGAGALRFWLRHFHVEPRAEILRALEGTAGGPQKPSGNLWISPGRYAFIWSGGPDQLSDLALTVVAAQPQAGGNS